MTFQTLGKNHDPSPHTTHAHLSGGSSELELEARGGIAEVVRANTLLGGVLLAHLLIPVRGTAHAESGCGSRHVVTVSDFFARWESRRGRAREGGEISYRSSLVSVFPIKTERGGNTGKINRRT